MACSRYIVARIGAAILLFLALCAVNSAGEELTPPQQRVLALADSLYANSAPDSAQTILAAAIPQARAAADSLYLQNLIVRQGAQLAAFGHVVPAEPILREALALSEARADSAMICQVLRWLGFSIANLGRWDEAEVTTRRQIEIAEALDLQQVLGWAYIALGWYAEQRGLPEASAEEYGHAVRIFRAVPDSSGTAWALNNQGNAQILLGDRDGAQRSYREASAIARAIDFTMVEAMAVNNLGVLEFDGGDPSVAVTRFRRAHELQTQLGHATERISTGLNIGYCLVYLDRLDEAAEQLEGNAAEAEAMDQPEYAARARLALASLRQRQGRTGDAKGLLRRIIHERRDLSPAKRAGAREVLATILAGQDSLAAALDLLEKATGELSELSDSPGALRVANLRGGFLVRAGRPREGLALLLDVEERARTSGLSGERVQALARAARAYRALDRPDSALAALASATAVWESERDLPLDPEWREQRGAVGSRIYTDWAAQRLEDKTDRGRLPEVFDELQRFKGRTLLERMSGPGQRLPEVIPEPDGGFLTLRRLQGEVLAADELLLDAYLGPETSLVFAVTRDEVRVLTWPPAAELSRRLGFFYDLHQLPATGAAGSEDAALAGLGRELGDLLLADVADLLAASRRIVVVPDGVLNLLPWSTLSVGASAVPGEAVELVDRQISNVPSAAILAALRSRDAPTGAAAPTISIRVFVDETADGASDLPAARREAAWLVDTFAGAMFGEGADSSSASATSPDAWAGSEVLHFATHARSHDASPWQSEIVLGAEQKQSVRAAEISRARLDAQLVVLAGCESAGGNTLSGEGVQGLTSAFLSAGTPAVLATLWPVDDRATSSLVRYFYEDLARGATVGAALVAAQRALRHNPATAHPFYWAGFRLVGDGNVTIELAARRSPWRRYGGLAALTPIFIWVVIFFIRRRPS